MSKPSPLPEPVEPPEKGATTSPYEILKNRDFLLYLICRFIASFAQQMLAVTVGWEIFERTQSTLALGFVGLAQIIPMFLFVFPAGHVADNYNRKAIVIWMTVVYGISCVAMTLISGMGASVTWMYVALFVMGAGRTYIWPASAAFMPQLVPRNQFAKAVTWNSGSFQVSAVLGPVAGGFVVALTKNPAWVYGFNVVASVVCVALLMMVKAHHRVASPERMSFASIIAGLKFVYKTKVVLGSITLDLFAVLLGGATAMLPVYSVKILGVDARGLGWLQAALPLGSLLMSLILVHRPPLQRAGHTLLWCVAGFGAATIGFGYSRWFWLSFAMLFICGLTDYISVVVRHTLVQLQTPDEMRGRVSAVNSLFIGTSNQMGELESGVVAHWTNPVFAVVSGGIGTLLVVILAAYSWPELRKYGRLDS